MNGGISSSFFVVPADNVVRNRQSYRIFHGFCQCSMQIIAQCFELVYERLFPNTVL
jgi:hypothetical protein